MSERQKPTTNTYRKRYDDIFKNKKVKIERPTGSNKELGQRFLDALKKPKGENNDT